MHASPLLAGLGLAALAVAQCPFANPGVALKARAANEAVNSRDHMRQYEVDDSDVYMTSDVGGPIADTISLKAGTRGSTLLEDFILRQKITRFDHERVSHRPPPNPHLTPLALTFCSDSESESDIMLLEYE